MSTVDEFGKLIEEQDEESANTVVVLLASNGIMLCTRVDSCAAEVKEAP